MQLKSGSADAQIWPSHQRPPAFHRAKVLYFYNIFLLCFYWFPSSNMSTAVSGGLRITQFGSFNYVFRRQMGCDIHGHKLWEKLQNHPTSSATGVNLGLPHLLVLSLEMQKGTLPWAFYLEGRRGTSISELHWSELIFPLNFYCWFQVNF